MILKPTVGTEFSTPGLPADWFVQQWAPAGAATVTQGLVAVDGAVIGQNELYEPGRSLEFVATFSDELQHIGFGIDFSDAPWAIFSTDLTQVYARTNNGLASQNTALGSALFGSPHRYRIEWSASGVIYFVDGVQVASHAVTMTAPMRPLAASDYNLSGAQLKNDWFRMSPYAATGTFVSRVFDAGGPTNQWGALTWMAATPALTSVAFSVRNGQSANTDDPSWTPWRAVSASGSQTVGQSRFLQYRVTLSTADPAATPEVQRVAIEYQAESPVIGDNGPTISLVAATADASSAVITWTTNVAATSQVESVGPAPFATVSDTELTIGHRLTVAGLAPGTTYRYKITSTDVSGFSSSEPVMGELTFTTAPPSFIDTTVADFSQGVSTNTSVTSIGDGAVSLTSSPGAVDFGAGPGLPATWQNNPWPTGGSAMVEQGALTVSGAWAGSSARFLPGQSIEITASFSANAFEHVGFAENLAGDGAWALFSTRGTTDSLFASTLVGGTLVDVRIPNLNFLGVPHTYRIDWTASAIAFSIDGALVSSQATQIAAPMQAIAGQFGVGTPLTVTALRLPTYSSSGSFASRIFDAGQPQTWDRLVSTNSVPDNTSLTFTVSTAGDPGGPWTTTLPLPASGGTIGGTSRYIRYEASFASTSPSSTPTVFDVTALTVGSHVNQAPTANSRVVADNENTPIAFSVTGSDPDGDSLMFSVTTQPLHGTVTATGPTFTYTPQSAYTGTDTFTFIASDGTLVSNPAIVTIFISHLNHVPLAAADQYTVNENTTLTVAGLGVLANDGDVDPGDVLQAVPVGSPAHGTLALGADGTFSYTPAPDFSGSDSFTYQAKDALGALSNVATVTITVNAVNHPPVAGDDSFSTGEDTALSVTAANGVLKNDTDVEPGLLTAALVAGPAAGQGALVLAADGSFTFTPAPEFSGVVTFTYQAKDAQGALSNLATVTITVNAVNDAPVAAAKTAVTNEDTATTITLSATDVDSSALTFSVGAVAHGTVGPVSVPVCAAAGAGSACTASVTYTPAPNYNGPDSFTYTANDGSLDLEGGDGDDHGERRQRRAGRGRRGRCRRTKTRQTTITLSATDVDSTALTFNVLAAGHGTLGSVSAPVCTAVGAGTACTASVTYTPALNYNGPDSFTYTANDGSLTSAAATVTITVNAVNDAPVAAVKTAATNEDTATTIALSATDVDSSALTFSVGAVGHGTVGPVSVPVCTAAGAGTACTASVTYTPAPNYNGSDSFSYTANDGSLTSGAATVRSR